MQRTKSKRAIALVAGAMALGCAATAAAAQADQNPGAVEIDTASDIHAGQLDVPVSKSQVLRVDQPYTRAMVGDDKIADILPISSRSLYVLGKQTGTTSLTLYGPGNRLIAVVDIAVGPDVIGLRRQLSELLPKERVGARLANGSIVLTGIVTSAPAADRAKQIAATYAGDKVVNLLSVGASQQVMLEVRFSEMQRSVAKQIGVNNAFISNNGNFQGGTGSTGPATAFLTNKNGAPTINLQGILQSFGVVGGAFSIGKLNVFTALDALENKGVITTLAEPTLIALSGDTASFLAGGEIPIPVAQNGSAGTGTNTSGTAITIEYKPFGVSLAFTPTVLDDGVINLVVAPEVSSLDPTSSVTINGLTIPGLQTRRAKTTLELHDGQSFAIAGLLRTDYQNNVKQFPILGSLPIVGALFRSTGFQRGETELVIIVTPRLIQPMRPEQARLPTDRVMAPGELDLFLSGRTDSAVGANPLDPNASPGGRKAPMPLPPPPKTEPPPGFQGPNGHELR